MKKAIFLILISLTACHTGSTGAGSKTINQSDLGNQQIKDHPFLDCMYQDSYFPVFMVDKCKYILLGLCEEIETKKPASVEEFYTLTHAATRQLNDLQGEFISNNSEIETGARECLAEDFAFIAKAYGFDADVEELIAPRDW